jgi:transcriptional regulator with GAF, ATPase, and Fis domain/tetratricopeptide (TPR) repeat protein
MSLSSHNVEIDNRLLAVEELLRQRKFSVAQRELEAVVESDFASSELQTGLFLCLKAECLNAAARYRDALDHALRGAKLLADFPVNRRFGRSQLTLSKAYSSLGDLKNAEMRARDALAAFRRAADPDGQVTALSELARISFIRCDYATASEFLNDALGMVPDNPRRVAQLTSNLGRIRILLGQWSQAEADLSSSIKFNQDHHEEMSEALNLLSIGYLHIRRREFPAASKALDRANILITRLELKRERVIYLEYAGELALERGEYLKAKNTLSEAYQAGRLLAPESSLVSQAARRLAEAELALDNADDAMKYGQKALDLALQLGEKAEVAMARLVIARIFAFRRELPDALEYGTQAVELAREIGDPVDLARGLLALADIRMQSGVEESEAIRSTLDEASRIFKKLRLDFWQAEADFRSGIFACQHGDLARGFRKLSRAEKTFAALDERAKVKAVNQFLHTLTDQAVALATSEENSYKVFGNLITPSELQDLKSGQIDDVMRILLAKTGASRAVIYSSDYDANPLISSFAISSSQIKKFTDGFQPLLGQEISETRPTLLLDTRRDPYVNALFPETPEPVASIIVVPFTMSDKCVRYLYLDKLSIDGTLNPFNQAELNFAVGFSDVIAFKAAEMQKMRLLEDNRRLKEQLQKQAAFPNLVTQNGQFLEMLGQLRQVIDSNISITIEGETGSGKDFLSRAIHYNSVRRQKRFISVNCAALPETLLESELFGYKRGAFTGADRDKSGLFEEADGGTFFLDEVADMPLSIQAKVLRVLEEKELVRLGETVPRKVDVRIISATNKDLKEMMAKGLFRQDLFYRLSALSFHVPSLRDRREDIPLLINSFLDGTGKTVSPEVLKMLVSYDWPGNIRELENEIKKLVLLSGESKEITPDILSTKIAGTPHLTVAVPVAEKANSSDVVFGDNYSLYDYLAFWEKRFIIKSLKDNRGVKKHAAAALNIPESTLRLKIKQYDIDLTHLDAVN